MFNSKTVFIIGAGASKEAKLPIGEELTERIADLLKLHVEFNNLKRGDAQIFQSVLRLVHSGPPWNENQFIQSGHAVAEAMELALSIDTFLETHSANHEFVMLGKLGIARAIATEERKSHLAPSADQSKPFNMRNIGATWYVSLARQLFTGISAQNPEQAFEDVSFIIFNYDRCLQIFLVRALQVYFRIDAQQAQEIVQRVRIIHPYGSLGSIFPNTAEHVPFGPERFDLLAAAERIQTFSESADSKRSVQIKYMVEQAETLVFLGFGFHEQNMKLLDCGHGVYYERGFARRAFATTYGLSESDTKFVRNQISHLVTDAPEDRQFGQWIFTLNGTCADLFRGYWRSLTA